MILFLIVDIETFIACSVVGSRLDYCNSNLRKTTKANLTKLQRVQNNLARVVLQKPGCTHAENLLTQLHWLLVSYRITYKIALIAYKALKFGQPFILSTCWSASSRILLRDPKINAVYISRCQKCKPHLELFVMALRQSGTCYHLICELMKLLLLFQLDWKHACSC